MLVLATLFWAGNFIVGKAAFVENIPPMSLVFFRWSLVWLILLPFTYKEIIKCKKIIIKNLPLLLFLALTSVGLFNSFTYLALVYTQVITPPIIIKSPLLKFNESKLSISNFVMIDKIPITEIIRPKIWYLFVFSILNKKHNKIIIAGIAVLKREAFIT